MNIAANTHRAHSAPAIALTSTIADRRHRLVPQSRLTSSRFPLRLSSADLLTEVARAGRLVAGWPPGAQRRGCRLNRRSYRGPAALAVITLVSRAARAVAWLGLGGWSPDTKVLHDVVTQVIPYPIGIPHRTGQQVLHPTRRRITGMFGDHPSS